LREVEQGLSLTIAVTQLNILRNHTNLLNSKGPFMKKKEKAKKSQEMPEFAFKEFTPEESKIYDEAVNKFREAIASGNTLRQAYALYPIVDKELEALIQADFLKIMIAERHFSQRQSLEDIAKALDVSFELVSVTSKRMLQEVGVTAANQFGAEFGDLNPKAND
jgi:hypothetical protein